MLHDSQSVAFMMSTIKRQAASCIFGLAPHIRDIITRRVYQLNDNPDIEYGAFSMDGASGDTISSYGINGGTQYISWLDDSIFVKGKANISNKSYWILNQALLSKSMCENMLGVNINEMTSEWEKIRYQRKLQETIKGSDTTIVYRFLVTEYLNSTLRKNDCLGTLLQLREMIPLKNELGEIKNTEMFLCKQPVDILLLKCYKA